MYEVFNEGVVVAQIRGWRDQLPGYRGLLPVRVAPLDRGLVYQYATSQQRGVMCPRCTRPLFTSALHVVAGVEGRRVSINTDEMEGELMVRKRQEGWHHARCWPLGGALRRWVPKADIERWLYRAGATVCPKPPTDPALDFQFLFEDLPPEIASLYATTHGRALWVSGMAN